MVDKIEKKDDVIVVTMAAPTSMYKYKEVGEIVYWGDKNDTPKRLINLVDNSAEHGRILKEKTAYINGLGIESKNEIVTNYLKSVKANEISEKLISDQVTFNGFTAKICLTFGGKPTVKFIKLSNMRACKSGTGMWYCADWDKQFLNEKIFYPFYQRGTTAPQSIYYYKGYSQTISDLDDVYPKPDYRQITSEIESGIELSKFIYYLICNGFSAGHILTFFNGKMPPETQKEIKDKFQSSYTGAENAGKVVLVFTDPENKGSQIENITPNGLAEQYDSVTEKLDKKILTGHAFPSVLLGIAQEGSLGDRTAIDLHHELYINKFAIPNQKPILDFWKEMIEANLGIVDDLSIKQLKLLDKNIPFENAAVVSALNAHDPSIVFNEIVKVYGIDVPLIDAQAKLASTANENIKSLNMKNIYRIEAIAKRFKDGKCTREQALMYITEYGLSPEQAALFLDDTPNELQFSIQLKKDAYYDKIEPIKIGLNYTLIDERDVDTIDIQMKDDLVPRSRKITDFLKGLVSSFRGKEPEKGFKKEVITLYKYDLRQSLKDKGAQLIQDNTRDFCKRMIRLTSDDKRLTFEQIDGILNDFGDNAWDFRGGWYGKNSSCRHVWKAQTYEIITPV